MIAMNEKRCNLAAHLYPLLIEAYHPARPQETLWSAKVEAPEQGGHARVYIPPLAKRFGHKVSIRLTYGDGTIHDEERVKT